MCHWCLFLTSQATNRCYVNPNTQLHIEHTNPWCAYMPQIRCLCKDTGLHSLFAHADPAATAMCTLSHAVLVAVAIAFIHRRFLGRFGLVRY